LPVRSTEYPGDAFSFLTVPSFVVCLGWFSVPGERYLVLATMNVLYYGGVQDWFGGPTESMTWPVASVNGEAPVATEHASWSNLKSLYR
jgi:hypothetical protein